MLALLYPTFAVQCPSTIYANLLVARQLRFGYSDKTMNLRNLELAELHHDTNFAMRTFSQPNFSSAWAAPSPRSLRARSQVTIGAPSESRATGANLPPPRSRPAYVHHKRSKNLWSLLEQSKPECPGCMGLWLLASLESRPHSPFLQNLKHFSWYEISNMMLCTSRVSEGI